MKQDKEQKSLYEQMGGTYTLGKDGIYYPDIVTSDEELHYGKYGMLRRTYLKEHKRAIYSIYLLEGRLTAHLNAVDAEANERMEVLVKQLCEWQGVTEELKRRDQMQWIGKMQNIFQSAEEIVLAELIYR